MLQLEIFVMFAQFINFGILYGIFKYTIADALSEKINERAIQLEKLKRADELYDEKMRLAEEKKEEILKQAQEVSKNIMNEAEEIAITKAESIRINAKNDVLAMIDGGKRELEKERFSMLSQVKGHIVDVSLRLNEKMFGPGKTNREFLEAEIAKMK
jgi:F-type H+-transporting ATPase subunit b